MAIFNKSSLRQQFVDLTDASSTEATQWLEKAKWKVNKAVDMYLQYRTEAQEDPRVEAIFETYKEADKNDKNDTIGIDGTLEYLEALGIEPEDPKTLVLAYILEAPSMGVFTRSGFVRSWTKAEAFDLSSMRSYLDQYYEQFQTDAELLKLVYDFTFGFLMEYPGQKLMPTATAIDYWRLLLLSRAEFEPGYTRLNQWLEFAEKEHSRGFSRDTWTMFLPFLREVVMLDPENLSKYDEMAAWPSAVDEYVEWLRDEELL